MEISNFTAHLDSIYVLVAGLFEIKFHADIVKQNLALSIPRMQPVRRKKDLGLLHAEINKKFTRVLTCQLNDILQATMKLKITRGHIATNNALIQPFDYPRGH